MPPLDLRVNGRLSRIEDPSGKTLLEVLRDDLDLTGTKYGCGEGQCGACTVIIDGEAVRSCVVQAAAAAGREVTTIEGLAREGRLHPVQAAFLEAGAFQCGYCTPGMILAAAALLGRRPAPSEAEVREGMEKNICRCGAYRPILAAVLKAAQLAREGRP